MAKLYFHYKNKPYKYLGSARHSETLEEFALYETLYNNELGKIWVRPKEMFFEKVTVEGVEQDRFAPVSIELETFSQVGDRELSLIENLHKEVFGSGLKEYIAPRFKHQSSKRCLVVARIRGTIVGYKFGFARNDSLFLSSWGGVAKAWRSVGVASALMEAQHQWCRENGFKFIETLTMNAYREMISLNLKYGFEFVGTQVDEAGDFKLVMRKKL